MASFQVPEKSNRVLGGRILKFLLVLCLLTTVSTRSWAGELKGRLMHPGVLWACDGVEREQLYPNPEGRTIYIKQAQLWFGMTLGGRSDFFAQVDKGDDTTVLLFTNWDHYDEPTGFSNYIVKYSPDWFTLGAGESLRLRYNCTNIGGSPTAHEMLTIWYTIESPCALCQPATN